ncbi:putative acyl-CoA thioester hydrolase [Uliginosibacterium sp. 31-16]|uniref:putative acyl-CoA thioester hydrolase n=1 Tax=Uliginosibacterium sp. 31-16 TaxID=3068315 RepID=UPI00273EF447|nr:putative acyl-CoA thioester hydrolase [Uliginosibacterium sp. 31-16]MDP5238757.1 putative acyl-CoA thioester hydrolase [Uliginosibacterium sp. 31-16]
MKSFAATTAASFLMLALTGCSLMSQKPVSPQIAPGTVSRPVLSAAEAAAFTPAHYFARRGALSAPIAEPWAPQPIDTAAPADFVVGKGGTHATVQQAVNAAIRSGKKERQFIKVLPGTYTGAVYVPIDAPAISIIGGGRKPADVNLELKLDALVLPAEYVQTVNPSGQFKEGDPAWAMFRSCADLPAAKKIDTPCATVMWVQADGFQMANLTVTNTLLDTVNADTHQAVALRSDGDRAQFEKLRLIGRQDTFLVNVGEAPTIPNKNGTYPTDKIARAYVKDCYIEGDTDFVFGRANAVFDNCEFRVVASRRDKPAIVLAPDTLPNSSLGFLVINSRFTGDAVQQKAGHSFIGRSWDQGAGGTGYLIGKSPNGQLVVRDSYIDASFSVATPWDRAATTNRMHTGNVDPARNLDDPAFNRLWEFNNYGPGVSPAPAK